MHYNINCTHFRHTDRKLCTCRITNANDYDKSYMKFSNICLGINIFVSVLFRTEKGHTYQSSCALLDVSLLPIAIWISCPSPL